MCGGDDVSSLCVSLGLFDRALSQPALLYMGIWLSQVFALMYLDRLYIQKVTQWAGSRLMVSVDTDNGDRLPVTTVAHSLTGGTWRCGWLLFVTLG